MRLLTPATTSLGLTWLLRYLVLVADLIGAKEVHRTAKPVSKLLRCCLPQQTSLERQQKKAKSTVPSVLKPGALSTILIHC